jgi:hypothetical protein
MWPRRRDCFQKLSNQGFEMATQVQLLARAVLNGIDNSEETGIFDYKGMERLAKQNP